MNGIVQDEPAINKWWCMTRPSVLYTPIPKLSEDQLSALEEEETWLKQNLHFRSELLWLLSLEHHRFWSQVIFNPQTMDGLISFLQEGLPYFVLPEFLVTPRIEDGYHETAKLVFQCFTRLGKFDSSAYQYFSVQQQSEMIYEHNIFTLPIMLDLCHLYGRENHSVISKLLNDVFIKQPRYSNDLQQFLLFLEEALKVLTHSFCGSAAIRSNCGEAAPLHLGSDQMLLADMSPEQCRDKLLYLLDTMASTAAFVDCYGPSCFSFHSRHFHTRLAMFYNDAVPQIEKKVEAIGSSEECISLYVDLKHKLNLAKMEMLRLFKAISSSIINNILERRDKLSNEELTKLVDEYLSMLTDCLTEHTFMQDYHNIYGVDLDLDTVAQISAEFDTIKYDYLMESVMSTYSVRPTQKKISAACFKSGDRSHLASQKKDNDEPTASTSELCSGSTPNGVELESLITEIKDILPDLGEGFVQSCLKHYNYQTDAVINALLEDSLPTHLKNLDRTLSCLKGEESDDKPKRLNVFDNDEFDIMTRDSVDTSRIHKGKRRTVPKNAFDLLNDKSAVVGLRDLYHRFGTLDTEGSMYDDEYDDTYDHSISIDEAGEAESRRQFVVPRVLRTREEATEDAASDEDDDEDEDVNEKPPKDAFCENPAAVRARRERQRAESLQHTSRGRGSGRSGAGSSGNARNTPNVVGNPKGQGQEKQVLQNRDRKNVHKSSRGNHNRRSGAQHKRNQGMIPS